MFLQLIVLLSLVIGVRAYALLPRDRPQYSQLKNGTKKPKKAEANCSFAVFLGSGGHTSEALALVSSLNFARYTPRTYIISEGDILSSQKALDLENRKQSTTDASSTRRNNEEYTLVTLPRARKVHQPLLSTPPTFLLSVLHALYYFTWLPLWTNRAFAEVLLVNGPGTCVSVVFAVWVSRFFGLPSPRVIYVESFARVKSLSLSGKILRRFVDRMIVQWPDILQESPGRGECHGWLV